MELESPSADNVNTHIHTRAMKRHTCVLTRLLMECVRQNEYGTVRRRRHTSWPPGACNANASSLEFERRMVDASCADISSPPLGNPGLACECDAAYCCACDWPCDGCGAAGPVPTSRPENISTKWPVLEDMMQTQRRSSAPLFAKLCRWETFIEWRAEDLSATGRRQAPITMHP